MDSPFDPAEIYLDLLDGGAVRRLPVDENFWPDVMSGKLAIEGRLVSAFRLTEDMDGWERHPQGDELLCLLDGAAEVIYEAEDGEVRASLDRDNRCFIVPKGAWHRFAVPEYAYVLFLTPGEGTEHRPL
jgi:mannose-6-phosphate isomerase-like protein (cupin superfamily)